MSRCFPFPPPGYEKKPNSDDALLPKEEKGKEKRHKKEKKDKDKGEGKEKRDKDRKEGKHKEKKDKKDKQKDKKEKSRDKKRDRENKSKNKDKKSVREESSAVGHPGAFSTAEEPDKNVINLDEKKNSVLHGQKAIEGRFGLNGEAEELKFVQELARRIKDEENGKGIQLAGRCSGEGQKEERIGKVVGVKVSRSLDEDLGSNIERSGVHDRKLGRGVRVDENGKGILLAGRFSVEGKKDERMDRVLGGKVSRILAEDCGTNMERSGVDDRKMDVVQATMNESRLGSNAFVAPNIYRSNDNKVEGMPMASGVKGNSLNFTENKVSYMEKSLDCRGIDSHATQSESRQSGNTMLPNITALGKSMFEGMHRPHEESNKRKEEKEKTKERGDGKSGEKGKDKGRDKKEKDRDKKRHKKSKDREKEKKKEKSKEKSEHYKLQNIRSNTTSELSRDNDAGAAFDVNLKKRKLVPNGFVHDDEARPAKILKPASHGPIQNGNKVETLHVPVNSNIPSVSEIKVANKTQKMNGAVVGQPSVSIPRPKLSPPPTSIGQIAEPSLTPPLADQFVETTGRTPPVDHTAKAVGRLPFSDQNAETLGKLPISKTLVKPPFSKTPVKPPQAYQTAETIGRPPCADHTAETLGKLPFSKTSVKPPQACQIAETLGIPPSADQIVEKPLHADKIAEVCRKPPSAAIFAEVSKKPSHINVVVEAPKRSPHPDVKYLNQILTVPKMEEWVECDDNNEWLFGSRDPSEKKSGVGSNVINEELQVWSEARYIESTDIYALPYVIPY
ncbi:unnamed protein product [Cuscuta epithymum]|uniref:Uncharacterized protein n=1 Tax=Cuscuta epithymum TaxID=186058 RepID=A0AAV0BZZ0_9ASTE|nr:unnamed protein product [Cuscuta epithymum]